MTLRTFGFFEALLKEFKNKELSQKNEANYLMLLHGGIVSS